MKGAGGPALPKAVANPDVISFSIRQDWADLEPIEGNFQWDYLKREITKATNAGKIVLLRINTQAHKSAWVTQAVHDAGGSFYTFSTARYHHDSGFLGPDIPPEKEEHDLRTRRSFRRLSDS